MYYITEGYTSKSNFESFTCRELSWLVEELSDSQEFFRERTTPIKFSLPYFRLLSQYMWDLHSPGMLGSWDFYLVT